MMDRSRRYAHLWILAGGLLLAGVFVLATVFATMLSGIEVGHATAARATLRTAQRAYSATQGGLFEARLECLERPTLCRSDYPGPAPLPTGSLEELRREDRVFLPGPPALPGDVAGVHASRSSVRSYVYITMPARRAPGWFRFLPARLPQAVCMDADGTEVRLPNRIPGQQELERLRGRCPSE